MYLKYYGLQENPFNVTSDPNFFYLSKEHKEAMGHLIYGIKERKGFLELTGEIGAGKTTVCKALLKELRVMDNSIRTAFILNPNLSETQLLEAIVEDFGISYKRRTKVSFLKQLNNFLLEELSKDSNVVLILDEAQNLKSSTLEAIRLLSNLETDKKKLFQILLVGQPQLRKKINSPDLLQLRQRISVRYHINPLLEEETEEYIYHRLGVAGCKREGGIRFTDPALNRIFAYSSGVPRLINLLCDKALLSGFVLERKTIDEDIIKRSISEIEGNTVNLDLEVKV